MSASGFLAFLDFQEFKDGSRRGGILVTDLKTEPVEFRCTDPVSPTNLQKLLWGNRLDVHVAGILMGKPLLQSLTNKPDLVLIRRPEFMELRTLLDVPLVQVLRDEQLAQVSSLAAQDGDDVLHSEGGRFEPVIVKPHSAHVGDRDRAREVLAETFRSFNILEPFNRVANGLEMVHSQTPPPPPGTKP